MASVTSAYNTVPGITVLLYYYWGGKTPLQLVGGMSNYWDIKNTKIVFGYREHKDTKTGTKK